METKALKITKTQEALLARAAKSQLGYLIVYTTVVKQGYKRVTEGSREYSAAEKLVSMGILKKVRTNVINSISRLGKYNSHTEHHYQLA